MRKVNDSKAKVVKMQSVDYEKENQSLLEQAANLEANKDFKDAEKVYQKLIKENPVSEFAYKRLMIIYRKQKKYDKELQLINKAIGFFRKHYDNRLNKKSNNLKIKQLSNTLMKQMGLADKKGNALYTPEPIATWEKRKQTVESRIK